MALSRTSRVLVVLVLVLLLAASVRAAVMGIDYGTEFIKVAAPKNKGIDIVLNEQSNRKSANFIGFRGQERYFGDDAKNLAPRFPDNMFTYAHHLVGVAFNDTARLDWFRKLMVQHFTLEEAVKPAAPVFAEEAAEGDKTEKAPTPEPKRAGTVSFRTGGNPDIAYNAETLTAMMFTFIRDMVAADTGVKVRDAVVTVPAYFNSRQRQAIIDSAALAGVNVVATMHTTTAFALQRGLREQGFGNATKRIVIFDMGTSRTDVGIYEFLPPTPPPKGKKLRNAEFYGQMITKAIVSDATVSGRALDGCLAQLIEDRFVEATKLPRVLGGETLAKRKSAFALMRAANKAKEMLTANKRATVIAEGMAPNKDFPTTITREEFESACAPIFKRAIDLVHEASKKANIKISEVDFLELVGGVSRIPKIGDDLSALRGSSVDRTLNGDEAGAIGAAFYGGVTTGRFSALKSFAVKEEVFITQPAALNTSVVFALSPKKEGDEVTFRPLFHSGAVLGQIKAVTVNRTEDFNISIAVLDTNGQKQDYMVRIPGVQAALRKVPYYKSSSLFAGLDIGENGQFSGTHTVTVDAAAPNETDKAASATELNHPNNTHSIRIEFRASESGLIVAESAEIRINYVKNVSKRINVNMTEEELAEEEKRTREAVIAREVMAEEEARTSKQRAKEAKKNSTKTSTKNSTAAPNATDDEAGTNSTKPELSEKDLEREANETARKQKVLDGKIKKAISAMRRTKSVPVVQEELLKHTQALKFRVYHSFPSPLTKGDKKVLKNILEEFDFADEQRRKKSKAKNDLDSLLVLSRAEGVLENAEMKAFNILTPEVEANVTETIRSIQAWLDDDATDATPTEDYIEKLDSLKAVVNPLRRALKAAKGPAANETNSTNTTATKSEEPQQQDGQQDGQEQQDQQDGEGGAEDAGNADESAGNAAEEKEDKSTTEEL